VVEKRQKCTKEWCKTIGTSSDIIDEGQQTTSEANGDSVGLLHLL
jgi:hypothetical protein